jgi:hypothetical protein
MEMQLHARNDDTSDIAPLWFSRGRRMVVKTRLVVFERDGDDHMLPTVCVEQLSPYLVHLLHAARLVHAAARRSAAIHAA